MRHIRVSNQGDVVPSTIVGYIQTGVNLHVKEGEKMEVGYRNPRSLFSQVSFRSAAMHSLEGDGCHYNRLHVKDQNGESLNKDDLDKSIEQLCDDYAGDCSA